MNKRTPNSTTILEMGSNQKSQYCKKYLAIFARIYTSNEQNLIPMFKVKLRRYCSATGVIGPHEVEELIRLKLNSLLSESQPAECRRPEDILNATYMTLILSTYPPILSRVLIRVISRVCRSLDRAQRRRTIKLFREGLAKLKNKM